MSFSDDRLSVISERTEYEDTETDADSSTGISETDAGTTTKTSNTDSVSSKEKNKTDEPTTEETDETSAATTEKASETDESTEKIDQTNANDSGTVTTEETGRTETDDTTTTGSFETTEDTSEATSTFETSASTTSDVPTEDQSYFHLLPPDILQLDGRHIRSEDFEWGTSPVPALTDIIVDAADTIEGSNLKKLLKNANSEQRKKIYNKLPLDLPFNITLPLIEDGNYWKRMCLESWPAYEIWRFYNNWKYMFVHKTIQNLIESFIPKKSDIRKLTETLRVFSEYTYFLQIKKMAKAAAEDVYIDLFSEHFDEQLDDLIVAPPKPIYLDFEKVFECLPQLQELIIIISPEYLDYENIHFSIPDFNRFFRGLRKLKLLQKLRISNGAFTNEQIILLIKLLLTHETLADLDFSYNFIDDSVSDYIGKLLISSCPVKSLVLKDNKITDKGLKSIAAALYMNSKLKKLDISLNMVCNEGGCFLARVLMTNTTIVELNLAGNKLRQKAGFAFAEVIKNANNIISLKIQENSFGEITGNLFLSALEKNHCMLELDVHFCGFSNEDEGAIYKYILRNRCKAKYSSCLKINESAAAYIF